MVKLGFYREDDLEELSRWCVIEVGRDGSLSVEPNRDYYRYAKELEEAAKGNSFNNSFDETS